MTENCVERVVAKLIQRFYNSTLKDYFNGQRISKCFSIWIDALRCIPTGKKGLSYMGKMPKVTNKEKDLEVIPSLKPSRQCVEATKRGNKILQN